jgi:hypothetical protein
MKAKTIRTGAATAVLACMPAFVFATYPLLFVVGENAAILPISAVMILRDVGLVFGTIAVLLFMSWPLAREFVPRAMWVSCFTLLFCGYGAIVTLAASLGAVVNPSSRRVAVAYTLASMLIATVTIRPRQARRRNPIPLNIVAGVLVLPNVYFAVAGTNEVRWRRAADALTETIAQKRPRSAHLPGRDIYYIVLDGFGRGDILQKYYGLDLDPFLAFLRSKGFYVPEQAHSNYSQTYLSLASTLNMNYLDDFAAAVGRDGQDRRPLQHLIRFNSLMKIAGEAGYQVIAIGSDYEATKRLDRADVCVCGQYGLDEIEQAALASTPVGALLLRWTNGAHRQKVLESFDALARFTRSADRKFVFAHIISPHPPFVFRSDGSAQQPSGTMYGFFDGDNYVGSTRDYVAGYSDQVRFLTRRLTTFIEDLLRRPGPAPVIVFHGDHGPGSMLRWDDPKATNVAERMSILAAYYFPDDGPALYPTMSPVNGARTLASRYFGVNLPFLPEKSALSTWARPYEFITVPMERPSTTQVSH